MGNKVTTVPVESKVVATPSLLTAAQKEKLLKMSRMIFNKALSEGLTIKFATTIANKAFDIVEIFLHEMTHELVPNNALSYECGSIVKEELTELYKGWLYGPLED